jgi:HPt (histidine-containing phosphotransfer) domain-containing protein
MEDDSNPAVGATNVSREAGYKTMSGEPRANSPVSEQASECLRGWIPPRLLRELAENGSGLEVELIEAFTRDTALRLEQLRRAITNSDAARLRMEAHTIKGSAWQMGADSVASMCQEIELAACQTPLAQLDERVDRLEARFDEVCRAMALYSNHT